MQKLKNQNIVHADKVEHQSKHVFLKKHPSNGIVSVRENKINKFNARKFINSKEVHGMMAEEVKENPKTKTLHEIPDFISAERVLDNKDSNEINTKAEIKNDGGKSDNKDAGSDDHKNVQRKEHNPRSGKAEIVIDSIKPTDTMSPSHQGLPTGMNFQYQADKLSCISKCRHEDHIRETQRRVCL